MLSRETVASQLSHTLSEIDIPNLGKKISGKVRDSYVVGAKRVLITSDRLSAFDKILTTIPFKGQLLNAMTAHWFEQTKDIIENHIIDVPHPNIFIARQVEIIPIEVVVRGYLTGSAWRDYQAGKAISGITLPKGLKKSQRFDTPLLTPSTKAEQGEHDMPISEEAILQSDLVDPGLWEQVRDAALKLFAFGTKKAAERGLILVDTKYEFGTSVNERGERFIVLADEIHTQDSSRYWMSNTYQERFEAGEDPHMLDKEFVRRHLMQKFDYMGDGEPPVLSDEFRIDTALRYIEACETITGTPFEGRPGDTASEIREVLANYSF
ncbi:MAG: phosphoribosylaminoimidazolesuccinocarboxamide synthase [Bdellovibrionales bacterium]|nr:phosphoribosylaminoimidazolesuccinocarboxamide synthase [Bdellovibrionales bacterium]